MGDQEPRRKYCINCFTVMDAEWMTCGQCHYVQDWPANTVFLKPPYLLNNQYIMGRVLGQGGFAITYLGFDRNLRTKVAIKEYMPVEFSTRSRDGSHIAIHPGKSKELFQIGKEKFIAEARMLATFRSPHIISVRQFFEANHTGYFVMEYLEGRNLTEYIKEQGGKLSFNQARDIILPLLDGLQEVHLSNTYHRDIKPDNIYITHQGVPILLDFGSARQTVSGVTSNLMAFLTPGYSPIEQYSVHGVQGPWTDIYALSATFYYMLTGETPPNPQDRIIGDVDLVPPSQKGVEISPEQEAWLLNGLMIKWSERPKNVMDWREALKRAPGPRQIVEDTVEEDKEYRFVTQVIMPKLQDKQLSTEDEEAIYHEASGRGIPYVRVRVLIEDTLNQLNAIRVSERVEQAELAEKRQALKQQEMANQAALDAQEEQREQLKAEEEFTLTESALLEKAQYLKALEERLEKEWELKQKEMELLKWEAELKQKTQTETVAEAPASQPSQAQSASPEIEEVDISEEELDDILSQFSRGDEKDTRSDSALDAPPKYVTLQDYYARLLDDLDNVPAYPSLFPEDGGYPDKLINSLGMTFVKVSPQVIKGDGFAMAEMYSLGPDEERRSILNQAFYIQTTPVTQAQWRVVMGNRPALFMEYETHPVEQVSWEDCQIFIRLLNQRKEAEYRLPREIEWEFACRAGRDTAYFFGDDPEALKNYAWYKANADGKTHPVARKQPNALGIYDLHGNVREWLNDAYTPWPEDEFKPKLENARVVRGGAWDYPAHRCTVAYRGGEKTRERKDNLGFRLVISLPSLLLV